MVNRITAAALIVPSMSVHNRIECQFASALNLRKYTKQLMGISMNAIAPKMPWIVPWMVDWARDVPVGSMIKGPEKK